jgi:hypothetical protein
MRYSIFYPTPLEEIKDITNDNIDVCVKTEEEAYTFVVATIENLKSSVWMDKRGFVKPSAPVLVVETLTKESIESLVGELLKDKTLAKIYGQNLEP